VCVTLSYSSLLFFFDDCAKMGSFDTQAQLSQICALVSGPAGHARMFGFATFDPERRAFRICECREDGHLSRSEALLLQVQPRSCCVVLSDPEDYKKLKQITVSCGVELVEAKRESVREADVEQDLLRLLQDTEGCGLGRHLEEQRQKQGMRALNALIVHHNLLSEPANFGACTLALHPLDRLMHLDKAAFSALNLLPRPEESLRSHTSVFGFLNRCRSLLGQRCLRQWLTQPLTSAERVASRHDVVEALSGTEQLLRGLEAQFRHVPDLERIGARLHRTGTNSKAAKADLEDLVTLYQCVLGAESMARDLSFYEGVHRERVAQTITEPLNRCLADFQGLRALVERTMDLAQAERRNYCIRPDFDKSLQETAVRRDNVRNKMEALRDTVDKELGLPSAARQNDKSVTLTDSPDGQAFRVTKKHQQAVTSSKGKRKFKTLAIKKQEFIFTIPELEALNKELSEAVSDYDKQSSALSSKALAVAATYRPVVDRLGEVLGSLDVLSAFARVALTAPCAFCRPRLDESGENFSIQGAMHVLVVANSEKSFVKNDLDMHKESSRLHLITGPNMGGKSTYIRSVALIALLNQIGSFVPCTSATLPLFDAIMCRVGASDMQLRGISTFMAEMLEASCILNSATSRSLVVIDELGRGTSTSDGFGIAWAIARHLADSTKCFGLFATHFHELAKLEDATSGVHNRHTTAAVDPASGKLTFLYALARGAADQSYGSHVAQLAGFPERVVKSAKIRAAEFEAGAHGGAPPCKRQRYEDGDRMSYIFDAADEEEFVARAMAEWPDLQAVAKNGGC